MSDPVEFKIDKAAFDDLSLTALRGESVAFFDENKLSGQERLFYRLWASKILKTVVFVPDQVIQQKDSVPDDAYVVISGEVQVIDESQEYRFGPGPVYFTPDSEQRQIRVRHTHVFLVGLGPLTG